MNEQQTQMMLELQQLGLTLDDLRIYLDTHLYDAYAIERYNSTLSQYNNLADEYSQHFGPLCWHHANNNNEAWAWALSNFPWDY